MGQLPLIQETTTQQVVSCLTIDSSEYVERMDKKQVFKKVHLLQNTKRIY